MPPSELRKEARESLAGKWEKGILIVLAYLLPSLVVGIIKYFVEKGTPLYYIIRIAFLIISIALSFGLVICFIKLKRGEKVNAFGYIKEGLKRFNKAWKIFLWTLLEMLLPIICLILLIILLTTNIVLGSANGNAFLVAAITVLFVATLTYTVSRGLLYVLSYYISYDNPKLSSKDCVIKSEKLMKGNRGNYLLLNLSFMGWFIVGVILLIVVFFVISLFSYPLLAFDLCDIIISPFLISLFIPYIEVTLVCFYDRVSKTETKKIEEEVKIEE